MLRVISSVAGVINADPVVSRVLRAVFLPDFNVTSGSG